MSTAASLPCPTCSGDGTDTHEDRHAGTNKDTCRTCAGTGMVEPHTGETAAAAYRPDPPPVDAPALIMRLAEQRGRLFERDRSGEGYRYGDAGLVTITVTNAEARAILTATPLRDVADLHAAVLAERESCAFTVECGSGLLDQYTIDLVAENIRKRGDAMDDPVHLCRDHYHDIVAAMRLVRADARGLTAAGGVVGPDTVAMIERILDRIGTSVPDQAWIDTNAVEADLTFLRRDITDLANVAGQGCDKALDALARVALVIRARAGAGTFQDRNRANLDHITADDPTDLAERRDRFGEESLELQQALGQTREAAHQLVDYVFGRPVGEAGQEFGGAMTTLAGLASHAGHDMAVCGERELARCWIPAVIEKIRRKRATRHGRGALPGTDAIIEAA